MFKPNPHAITELEREAEFQQLQQRAAREVVGEARSIAPDGGPHRGYRETLRVGRHDGDPTAETTDPFSHLIEFGSANNPTYAPLRRAVRAAGLDYRDE